MIPLASPRTCLLVASAIGLLLVLMLMVTAPVREAVEPTFTPQTVAPAVIYNAEEAP